MGYPAFLLLLLALSAQSQPLGNNGADDGSNGGAKTVNCPPGTAMASGCSGTHCEVSCGSEKVEMECPDEWINVNGSTVNGTCVGTHCVVDCGNGKKVEMECPDEWININGSTATCGKKPACFPFCDKEGQPLKGCFPGSPGFPFC